MIEVSSPKPAFHSSEAIANPVDGQQGQFLKVIELESSMSAEFQTHIYIIQNCGVDRANIMNCSVVGLVLDITM